MTKVLEYFKIIDYAMAYVTMDTEYCKAVFPKMYEQRYLIIPFVQRALKNIVNKETPDWVLQFMEMSVEDLGSSTEENTMFVLFNILNYTTLEIQNDSTLSMDEKFALSVKLTRALIYFSEIIAYSGKFPENEKSNMIRFSQRLALVYPEQCNYIYDLTSDILHLSMVLSSIETELFGFGEN